MPVYPLALTAFGWVVDDLVEASHLLGLLSVFVTLTSLYVLARRAGAGALRGLAAVFAVATAPQIVQASLESLPDGLALTWLMLALVFAYGRPPSSGFFLSGVFSGLAFATRLNLLAVVPLLGFVAARRVDVNAESRRRSLYRYALGLLLGVAPFLFVVVALRTLHLSYPFFSLAISHTLTDSAGAKPSVFGALSALLSALLSAIIDTPKRLGGTLSPLLAIACTLVLLVPVLRFFLRGLRRERSAPSGERSSCVARVRRLWMERNSRNMERQPLFQRLDVLAWVIVLLLCGPLLAMHYEPRYYLFAIPMAVLFLVCQPKESLGLAKADVIVLGLCMSGVWGMIQSEHAVKRDASSGAEWAALCAQLVQLGDPVHAPVISLVDESERWSALRFCPRPLASKRVPGVRLVHSTAKAWGIDAFLLPGPPGGPRYRIVSGRPLPKPETEIHPAENPIEALVARPMDPLPTLVVELPARPRDACKETEVDVPRGRHALELDLALKDPFVARIVVTTDKDSRDLWSARAARLSTGALESAGGAWRVRLCAVDENAARGRLSVTIGPAVRL
ncbi:MAG: glycosyltransferase family 39 protein [Deltaproteobacteria bacterium]|nr:glycosyltransferase family 39 protein [Deltaproteobacteria bacterium]